MWYYAFHYHDCRTSKVSSWSLIFFSSWTLTSTKTLIHPLQSWPQVLHKLDIINFSSLKWDLSCGWKQNRILIFLITNRSNIQGNLMKYDNVTMYDKPYGWPRVHKLLLLLIVAEFPVFHQNAVPGAAVLRWDIQNQSTNVNQTWKQSKTFFNEKLPDFIWWSLASTPNHASTSKLKSLRGSFNETISHWARCCKEDS